MRGVAEEVKGSDILSLEARGRGRGLEWVFCAGSGGIERGTRGGAELSNVSRDGQIGSSRE